MRDPEELQTNEFLSASHILGIDQINTPIMLPSYKFKTGWGSRCLSRIEKFNMWGLNQLSQSTLSEEELLNIIPIQPLTLIVNAHLSSTVP